MTEKKGISQYTVKEENVSLTKRLALPMNPTNMPFQSVIQHIIQTPLSLQTHHHPG
jgi:hypothetical protein